MAGVRQPSDHCWRVFQLILLLICGKHAEAELRYSIPEEVKDGTVVGNVSKDLGLDKASLMYRRLRVVSGSKDTFFEVNTDTGALQPKAPNADWRYSASLRAGGVMQSSVHMEESSVMQGAQGVLVQNWPTASSAADGEGGEVSPPMGAGVDSNSWHFRYGPGGPGAPPQHLKPGEVPPEAFIIPGSPAIISIRQNQGGEDDKSDFITFGKKEEAKKKKKKKKEKKDKKDKGKDDDE
ncbi:protocadherin alpha-8-like isoform X37 [Melanotaenia boesemani]|uniref:protocadherin alpha-8-like isoform X37 n=1 Tax=Melanotaenia boesemani TaxID=1250792 RepID=UPI001C045069|nr:protocadherin alpha-8-like isoform X37 [Melanotaenia boesemani]